MLVDGGMSGILPAETAAFKASTHAEGRAFTSGELVGYGADHASRINHEFGNKPLCKDDETWRSNGRVVRTIGGRITFEQRVY